MFVGEDFDGPGRQDDSATDLNGVCHGDHCRAHGTSMLALVTGRNLGASKNVEPWVVRVPRRNAIGGGGHPEDWLRGLTMINQRITEATPTTQAVVLLSWIFNYGFFHQLGRPYMHDWKARLAAEIESLIDKGVFVVTGSGNTRQVSSERPNWLVPRFQPIAHITFIPDKRMACVIWSESRKLGR